MVSIIIPTYNDSGHLAKTIASCIVQDIEPEVIVVDDFSQTPIHGSVWHVLSSVGGTYIRNKVNVGLAETRDVGISSASGEFILPLDTQDWLYPHVLGKMVSAMQGADVVFGNMTEIDDGKIHIPDGAIGGVTRRGMMRLNQLWTTSMFRKSLWERVGGYKNGMHTSYEDYAFWNKCLMAGAKFKYVDELIYRHTYNPNSMLSKLHKETDKYNEIARTPLYG